MSNELYSFKVKITDSECDLNANMTIGALMRRAQQAATEQCTDIGITDEVYKRNHCVFLLAKTVLEYYAPIKHNTELTVITHPGTPERAAFYRYTEFLNDKGELLAALDSQWVLVDTETKRIMRRYPEEIVSFFQTPAYKKLDMSVAKPQSEDKEAAQVAQIAIEKATYTRCDTNRHLNNTRYADIVCDAMPLDVITNGIVKRFAITYHREVPLGESFALSCGKTESGSTYFIGATDDVKHFEAEITM